MSKEKINPVCNFNIISLDGCGVRSVIGSIIIERLAETYPKLLRDVDLIVGTGAGGIQALKLASNKRQPDTRDLYEKMSKYIFADSFLDDFRDPWKQGTSDYSNKNFKKALYLQFGDSNLSDLEKKVAVPAFDLDNGYINEHRSWKLKVFHNFEGQDSDGAERVTDVALRTASTPSIFPTTGGFIDASVVTNNPSMIAIAQALDSRSGKQELNNIKVLSLGTGKTGHFIKGNNHDWGATQWSPYLLHMMAESSTEMVHFQTKQLLGDKYCRINPILDAPYRQDDWKKISKLIDVAENINLTPTLKWLEVNWQ